MSQRDFWLRRHAQEPGIFAVGTKEFSEKRNHEYYRQLTALFRDLVREDFDDVSKISVLDLGYGQGHYARVCHDLGVGRYVGLDFASPTVPFDAPGFRFERMDISEPFDFGAFDLVTLIDVAFHVVDDAAFANLLDNVRRSAQRCVYVTGLFRDANIAAHVRHRTLSAFATLGQPIDIWPWRDTLLLRIHT